MKIFYPYLGALCLSQYWFRRGVELSLLSLLRLYSNSLSISQIGHQWLDWLPRWITSFPRFYHPSGWPSRPVEPSRPSLDFPPGLRTIKRNWPPIEDQWKRANVEVPRRDSLIMFSQSSFCRFTHKSSNRKGWLSLHHRSGKTLALLWADTQARSLTRLL